MMPTTKDIYSMELKISDIIHIFFFYSIFLNVPVFGILQEVHFLRKKCVLSELYTLLEK